MEEMDIMSFTMGDWEERKEAEKIVEPEPESEEKPKEDDSYGVNLEAIEEMLCQSSDFSQAEYEAFGEILSKFQEDYFNRLSMINYISSRHVVDSQPKVEYGFAANSRLEDILRARAAAAYSRAIPSARKQTISSHRERFTSRIESRAYLINRARAIRQNA